MCAPGSATSRTEVRPSFPLSPLPPSHSHPHALVTPRRWLDQCNPGLSHLIADTLRLPKALFLKEFDKLEGLLQYADNAAFQKKWAAVKQSNKERLAHYVETTLGMKINTRAMFDVQIKRLHEYKVRCGERGRGRSWS